MAFPWYKSIDSYIVNELKARTSENNVELSKLIPWIKATSNLGDRYTIGTETYSTLFDNSSTDAYANSSGSNFKYRPNPIITDFSVDFASRGTLRRCTLKIKCFTPDQLTKVQEYFLEPGISCYVQWGWNYSLSGKKAVGPTPIDAETIKSYNRNAATLNEIRQKNYGCYDNFVGIIGGGESNLQGTEFEVTIKMVSLGEILMGKSNETVTPVEDTTTKPTTQTSHPSTNVVATATTENVYQNWIAFYNELPEELRTKELIAVERQFRWANDFVNYWSKMVEEAKYETTSGLFSGNLNYKGKTFQAADSESPVNGSKFISFEAFIKLLNFTRIKFKPNNIIDFNIDIKDTYIGCFSGIFSTDDRILIPNKNAYNFLNDIPLLGGFSDTTLDLSINTRSFPRAGSVTINVEGASYTLPSGGKYGWIGDIYLEHEMAMEALKDQTTPVKEILDNLLKKMEDAVQGLWSFQIIEDSSGTAKKLRIVDANLRNVRNESGISEFNMFGTDSFFLDVSFNLDIPKEMASKVYMSKSTEGVQAPDELIGLFSDKKDNVLGQINKADSAAPPDPPLPMSDLLQKWIEFRRNVRIVVNPGIVKRTDIGNANLDLWAIPAIYLNKRKFNDIRKRDLGYSTGAEVYNGRSLPVSFDFSVLGMSGFQVGQLFNIKGLPPQYSSSKGAFQVEEITHKIDGKQWITEVKSHFRPFYK